MSENDTPAGGTAPAGGGVRIEAPGVYEIGAEVYHADPVSGGSLSSTGARKILEKCPAIFQHERLYGAHTTRAMDFGTVVHRVILGEEPDVVHVDADNWRKKADQLTRSDAAEDGRIAMIPREWNEVEAMAAALRAHPIAGPLFQPGNGRREQSLFWRDQMTGVNRRARLDWMTHTRDGRLVGVDYKTTVDASLDGISKAILKYRYDQQATWYQSGMRALGLHERPGFIFVFQEKTAPYLVTLVELTATTQKIGQARNRQALEVYARCERSGYWPGYAEDVTQVALPPWAENRELEEMA